MTQKELMKKHYEAPAMILLGEIERGAGINCVTGGIVGVLCTAGSGDGFFNHCRTGAAANFGPCAPGGTNLAYY